MSKDSPHPFQLRVDELIRDGQSVILQAPTGAGKTRAALLPFAHSMKHDGDFPRKAIYSVPMRVLANQFFDEFSRQFEKKGLRRKVPVSIQTGDRPSDPQLEASLIFATIDQTLSSFLHIPYGLSQRRANMNAGAVASSYLIFDEVHLFPPDNMLPTTLAMLRMLKGLVPFILMTATFSARMLEGLAEFLDARMVPGGKEERQAMQALPSQQGKARTFYAYDGPLTAAEVLDKRKTRTLCVCNTVARAQDLYADLHTELGAEEVTLLHSRFLPQHRNRKESAIREIFHDPANKYKRRPHILVATQVVEVGLDITSDVLLTETAPAATLVQRAGRCARREREIGEVHVYRPRVRDGDHAGKPDYAPYYIRPKTEQDTELPRGLKLCENTWDALISGAFTDRPLTWDNEQAFVDQAHAEVDQDILQQMQAGMAVHMDKMLEAMRGQEYGLTPELVRSSADSRFVIVCDNPNGDDDLLRNPFYYEGFSVSPGTLYYNWKVALEGLGDDHGLGPLGWRATALPDDPDREYGQHAPRYTWEPLYNPGDAYQGGLTLALNPTFATYNDKMGLHFLPDSTATGPMLQPRSRHPRTDYVYHRETYHEHINGLLAAYEKQTWLSELEVMALPLHDELACVIGRLEAYCGVTSEVFERVMRVVIATHDLGKLDEGWQAWAREWQEARGLPLEPGYLAAHTDYNPGDRKQRELQKAIRTQKPNHAGESAWAAAHVIWEISQQDEALSRAATSTIMRHHSPGVRGCQPYSLSEHAQNEANRVLQEVTGEFQSALVPANGDEQPMESNAVVRFDRQTYREVVLYSLLVRALRLADQRSQIMTGLEQ